MPIRLAVCKLLPLLLQVPCRCKYTSRLSKPSCVSRYSAIVVQQYCSELKSEPETPCVRVRGRSVLVG
uniref:Putative secreted protein n=1 Tax=Anopheles darlingi TaxID=43151 RepID=A0A2M4D7Q6_ANODA